MRALAAVLAVTAALAGCRDAERVRQNPPLPSGTPARFSKPLVLLAGRQTGRRATIELRTSSSFSNEDLDMAAKKRFTHFEAFIAGRPGRVSLKQSPSLFEGNSKGAEGSYSPASEWNYWIVVRAPGGRGNSVEVRLRGCTADGECDERTADARFEESGRLVPTT
jgi:hypothetical protein